MTVSEHRALFGNCGLSLKGVRKPCKYLVKISFFATRPSHGGEAHRFLKFWPSHEKVFQLKVMARYPNTRIMWRFPNAKLCSETVDLAWQVSGNRVNTLLLSIMQSRVKNVKTSAPYHFYSWWFCWLITPVLVKMASSDHACMTTYYPAQQHVVWTCPSSKHSQTLHSTPKSQLTDDMTADCC